MTRLVAVPYSEEYAEWLEPAAEHLRRAAAKTDNESLRIFLELRADAFFSDNYFDSDMAWMDLASPVEVTIGPYEVYEDSLFGYKTGFEAFLTVDIPEESAALARYKEMLPWLERNLPIDDEIQEISTVEPKAPSASSTSSSSVVNRRQVYRPWPSTYPTMRRCERPRARRR